MTARITLVLAGLIAGIALTLSLHVGTSPRMLECGQNMARLYDSDANAYECHDLNTVTFYIDPTGNLNWYITNTGPTNAELTK